MLEEEKEWTNPDYFKIDKLHPWVITEDTIDNLVKEIEANSPSLSPIKTKYYEKDSPEYFKN